MKVIERLYQYIEYKTISLNAFDVSIGASNGYIGKQIKNNASIGSEIIQKISEIYTDLSMEWLISGNGPMLKSDKTDSIEIAEPIDDNSLINYTNSKIKDLESRLKKEKEILAILKKGI